ncbi:MAG: hypothetical protein QFF03_01780 [Pseudomonadota bacterium]|nr:hypothetical protein [Pseudomonadota bacterium]
MLNTPHTAATAVSPLDSDAATAIGKVNAARLRRREQRSKVC